MSTMYQPVGSELLGIGVGTGYDSIDIDCAETGASVGAGVGERVDYDCCGSEILGTEAGCGDGCGLC